MSTRRPLVLMTFSAFSDYPRPFSATNTPSQNRQSLKNSSLRINVFSKQYLYHADAQKRRKAVEIRMVIEKVIRMSNLETQETVEAPKQEESPRIGVFVCHCGMNIAGTVDVKQ